MLGKRLSVRVMVGSVLIVGAWGRTVAFAGEGAVEPPLVASLLPERTLALFVVENVAKTIETYRETNLYRLWLEDEVQAFLKPVLSKLRDIFSKTEEAGEFKFADFAAAFGGQVSLAFVGLRMEGKGEPLPEIAFVAEITDRAAVSRLLERAGRAINAAGKVQLKTWNAGPLSFGRIAAEGERMQFGYVLTDAALYMGLGPEGKVLGEIVSAATGGEAASLASRPEFLKAVERAGDRRDLFGYLDVRRSVDILFDIAAAEGNKTPEELAVARRVLGVLGLDAVRSVSFVEVVDPPGFRSQLFVHAPSPRKGIFDLLSEEPVRDSMLRLAPAQARSLTSIRLRAERILPLVREVLEITEPSAAAQLDQGLAQLKMMTNIDIESDLIEGLGLEGELIVAPVAVAGVTPLADLAGIAIVVRVARPAAFKPVYDTAMVLVGLAAAGRGIGVSQTATAGGTTVKTFTVPMVNVLGIAPSVALTKRHLVIGLSSAAVVDVCRAVEGAKRPGLIETDEYRRSIARLGVEPGFLVAFALPPRAQDLQPALNWAPMAGPYLNRATSDRNTPPELRDIIRAIDLTKLPSAATLTKYGLPQVAVGWTDEDGVGLTAYAPVGMSSAVVAISAVGAAVVIPNIGRARGAAPGTPPSTREPGDSEDFF